MSGALVVGVLVEMLLFRMFARTGIYLINDDTPRWVYQAYSAAVWFGNTMFNFAVIIVMLLFGVMAVYLWMRRNASGMALSIMVAAIALWNVALFFFSPGPALTLLYLALSAAIIIMALAVAWKTATSIVRLTLVFLVASFMCVYYFETIAPLRQAGWIFEDHGIGVFQIGEALAGVSIVIAFVAWGRTRNLRLIALPAIAGILLVGSYFSDPSRFPLISTWALGVTMSMPFLLYAAGAALLGVTILKQVTSGKPLVGYGLALLFFSHRMLPLTYFNLLIIGGFLLIAIALMKNDTSDSLYV
ncbi:MAG: hypothetical protein IIC84_03940 [Chloroflexi bacterium]|nr:hypothetical protein [Chloroflexota bacterium]